MTRIKRDTTIQLIMLPHCIWQIDRRQAKQLGFIQERLFARRLEPHPFPSFRLNCSIRRPSRHRSKMEKVSQAKRQCITSHFHGCSGFDRWISSRLACSSLSVFPYYSLFTFVLRCSHWFTCCSKDYRAPFVPGTTQNKQKKILIRVGLEPTRIAPLASDVNSVEALLYHLKLAP